MIEVEHTYELDLLQPALAKAVDVIEIAHGSWRQQTSLALNHPQEMKEQKRYCASVHDSSRSQLQLRHTEAALWPLLVAHSG